MSVSKNRCGHSKKPSQKYQEQGQTASRGALVKAPYEGYEVRVRFLVKEYCACSDKGKKIRKNREKIAPGVLTSFGRLTASFINPGSPTR